VTDCGAQEESAAESEDPMTLADSKDKAKREKADLEISGVATKEFSCALEAAHVGDVEPKHLRITLL